MDLNPETIGALEWSEKVPDDSTTSLTFRTKRISSIAPCVFEKYRYLQELFLGANMLTELPKGLLDRLTELRVFYVRGNKITNLDPDLFKNNRKLEIINVACNEIERLHEEGFHNLFELREFYFYNNKIATFDFRYLLTSVKLEELHFHHNFLSEVNVIDNLKASFPLIKKIDLRGNMFSFSYLHSLMQCLEKQGIKIARVDKNKGFHLDSVYGIKCVPDNILPVQRDLQNFKELWLENQKEIENLKEQNQQLRMDVDSLLQLENSKVWRKLDELQRDIVNLHIHVGLGPRELGSIAENSDSE